MSYRETLKQNMRCDFLVQLTFKKVTLYFRKHETCDIVLYFRKLKFVTVTVNWNDNFRNECFSSYKTLKQTGESEKQSCKDILSIKKSNQRTVKPKHQRAVNILDRYKNIILKPRPIRRSKHNCQIYTRRLPFVQ